VCELQEAEELVEMEVECGIKRRIELVRSRRIIGNRSERDQKEKDLDKEFRYICST
jgi:hypothetical protein